MSTEKLHNILTGFCQMKEKERNKEETEEEREQERERGNVTEISLRLSLVQHSLLRLVCIKFSTFHYFVLFCNTSLQ